MADTSSLDALAIRKWIEEKTEPEIIRDQLQAMGHPENIIEAYIKEYKRLKGANKRFYGFIALGVGSVMGFISTVLTLINPIPELFNIILYGLTSVALIILIIGLYLVLES
jgi:hypothetical protein